MSLIFTSLNSGSNGNCYYVGNTHEAVLIDAGLTCRETEKRMDRLGLSMQKIRAIFISHEHIDHIKGLDVLARKYSLPVYITPPTLQNSGLSLPGVRVLSFTAHQQVLIGQLAITALPKLHDAADPHSFVVDGNGLRIGVFTDIGSACNNVIRYFGTCHAAFLEANYDDELLDKGSYPYHLKSRIKSNVGHLSNAQAVNLFATHRPGFMSHLLLAHLSKDNNRADVAEDLFKLHADDVHIAVASRFEETAIFKIEAPKQASVNAKPTQYTLF